MSSATTGIRILLDTKSNISRIDIPLILMPLNTPNPSDDGIAITIVYMVTHIVINLLLLLVLSTNIETTVSISEMADVRAANSTRTKNTAPII